jgi:DNA-binding GntR family transcriptional regulator
VIDHRADSAVEGVGPIVAKPERLTTVVRDRIRDAIVHRSLAPGTRVTEARLAAALGVSKTPVREALQQLAATGLVEFTGPKVCRVVTPSDERIRDAYDLRATLEAGVVRLAAQRATDDESAELLQIARASLDAAQRDDDEGFRRHDGHFHARLAEIAAHERLAALVADASSLTRALRDRDSPAPGHSVDCAHYHVQIADAVRSHDPDSAVAALLAHLDLVRESVLRARAEVQILSSITTG